MGKFTIKHGSGFDKSVKDLVGNCQLISALLERAYKEKHKVYLVGGWLRNILLGKSSKDADFVTQRALDLAKSVARQTGSKPVLIDRKFGTIRFIPAAGSGEEAESCQVDLSPLRGASIVDDLQQRDFTVNALAIDMSAWQTDRTVDLLDPLDGILDLQAGRLHACSHRSLTDDPLRILRAYRLVSTYGFTLSSHTRKSIIEARHDLNEVALERIRDELVRILCAQNSVSIFRMLDDDSVLGLLLPECKPMRNLQQNELPHEDVWQHSLSALESLECFLGKPEELFGKYGAEALAVLSQRIAADRTRQIAVKLGVLLHDIGKPSCRVLGKEGASHFYGHEVAGARLAATICARLRFSKKEIDYVSQLVRQHMRPIHLFNLTHASTRALTRFFRLGPELFWPLLFIFASDYRTKQALKLPGGNLRSLRQRIGNWLDFYYNEVKPRELKPPLVSGHDLIRNLHLSPGPVLGKLLHALAELQWEGRISTRQEALEQAAQLLKQWTRRSQESGVIR